MPESLLLRILVGDLQPSAGKFTSWEKSTSGVRRCDGENSHRLRFLELVDSAKVWENFFMGRELTKKVGVLNILDIKNMKNSTAEAIGKYYGRELDIDREAMGLSGGQRRILAVSRAVEANPAVLLLDEPTLGLSERVIKGIFDFLKKARDERGLSIIIAAQWYDRLEFVDEIIVLRRGEVAGHFEES